MTKRKRRIGDRSDGRKLRTLDPVVRVMPFIMRYRSDAMNMFSSSIEITKAEAYVKNMHEKGYDNFGLLHIFIAAYVRTVSQRPAINRFVAGQQIYARNTIDVSLAIKKDMTLDSPETCIKVSFEPTDTPLDIYNRINEIIRGYKDKDSVSNFDKTARLLNITPRFLLKFALFVIRSMDYLGILPKGLLKLSPFHSSMFITSMGSLGIPPIFHHIYDLGNISIFLAYGKRRRVYEPQKDGSVLPRTYSDICVVTDERVVDGFYYASAFKMMQRLMRNPESLDTPPETVKEDID